MANVFRNVHTRKISICQLFWKETKYVKILGHSTQHSSNFVLFFLCDVKILHYKHLKCAVFPTIVIHFLTPFDGENGEKWNTRRVFTIVRSCKIWVCVIIIIIVVIITGGKQNQILLRRHRSILKIRMLIKEIWGTHRCQSIFKL